MKFFVIISTFVFVVLFIAGCPDKPVNETFQVTISASPTNAGQVSGEGTFEDGSEVTVIATPNNNWGFAGWFEDNIRVSDDKLYTFKIDNDRELTAYFTQEFIITLTHSSGGTIKLENDDEHIALSYAELEGIWDIKITWHIKELNGFPDTFVMLIERQKSGDFTGVVELEGSVPDIPVTGTVEENGDILFSFVVESHTQFIPDYHFYFTGSVTGNTITGNCEMYEDEKSKIPDKEGTFQAKIREAQIEEVRYGDTITFIIEPDNDHDIDDVKIDWISEGPLASHTFNNINKNHYLHAEFKTKTHTIVATSGEGGTIVPAGLIEVEDGNNQTFEASPTESHVVDDMVVDGFSIGPLPSYTFINVTEDHTIYVIFKLKTFIITATAGEGGSIVPSGEITVSYGSSESFEIIPDEGYAVDDVKVDGSSIGEWTGTWWFHNIKDDHSIHASFKEIPSTPPDFNMLYISSKDFPMGDDEEQTTVNEPFYIGETEVTYELWYTVRFWAEYNGYTFDNKGREGSSGQIGADPTLTKKNHPVTSINWRDAVIWCNALSEMIGKEPVYRDIYDEVLKDSTLEIEDGIATTKIDDYNGYRLPTNKEWELAARYIGPNKPSEEPLKSEAIYMDGIYWTPGNYPSGASDDYENESAVDHVAWYRENSGGSTKNVGQKAPNTRGIYDMSGNVSEWCFNKSGASRVIKGGDWYSEPQFLRVGDPYQSLQPSLSLNKLGFRIARTVE
ncbi:MAG: formylglycine-generating enzyme family protein [Kosmotoga sp.]|nr:MAG: formylglycine-generating enzyme family protein [Kosmotoga sp.]